MKPAAGGAQRKISAFFAPKGQSSGGSEPSALAAAGQSSKAQGSTPAPSQQQPAAKRARSGTSAQEPAPSPIVIDEEPGPKRARATPQTKTPHAQAATTPASIPARDEKRAAKAQRKLVTNKEGDPFVLDPTTATPQTQRGGTQQAKVKFTPLEQQVVDLKAKHPGVILVIEVGYKFRAFGEDAEVCARLCNIYAFPDHNFLTCGFPVYRLPVYVRRLVNAGHKVGVVRQVETAAIKSQSASRNAPFERKLTALFTAATLDAGQRAEKAGEEGSLEEFAELDESAIGTVQKYILFVAEAPASGASGPSGPEVMEITSSEEGEGEGGEEGGEEDAREQQGAALPAHTPAGGRGGRGRRGGARGRAGGRGGEARRGCG